jgi:uncharacterized iron-regulated membrane protein
MGRAIIETERAAGARGGFKRRLIRLHRWLGLAAALFWLLQATTGIASLFHWELEDLSVSSVTRATDLGAIETRLDALAPAGSGQKVVSLWTTAGLADRYDVTIENEADKTRTVIRIAGDGTVLRTKPKVERSVFDTIVLLHQKLLLGDTGSWIVGISGTLLLTNILLGLRAAWPRAGQWRAAFLPPRRGPRAARLYALHRALGLAAAAPFLLFFAAGTTLVFEEGVSALVGAKSPSLPAVAPNGRDIGFARAAGTAMRALDARGLTMVAFPGKEDATYRVRVLAPGELRRAYGTSTVLVAAADGKLRGVFPAASAPGGKAFVDALYAVHTGEILGLGGRLMALCAALWLATMTILGVMLWASRRRGTGRAKSPAGAE